MTTDEYKKLLIETVKSSGYKNRDELIQLLNMVTIILIKTDEYARGSVWNQKKEKIYISITPDKLAKLQEHYNFLSNSNFAHRFNRF